MHRPAPQPPIVKSKTVHQFFLAFKVRLLWISVRAEMVVSATGMSEFFPTFNRPIRPLASPEAGGRHI
jgi:hypothetical protein